MLLLGNLFQSRGPRQPLSSRCHAGTFPMRGVGLAGAGTGLSSCSAQPLGPLLESSPVMKTSRPAAPVTPERLLQTLASEPAGDPGWRWPGFALPQPDPPALRCGPPACGSDPALATLLSCLVNLWPPHSRQFGHLPRPPVSRPTTEATGPQTVIGGGRTEGGACPSPAPPALTWPFLFAYLI